MIASTTDISSTDSLTTAVGTPRVLIAAGGTGGHVYPAIAIADALKELRPPAEILFVGTRSRMEWKAVPEAGYKIESVWISGLHRRLTLKNLLFPLKLVTSLMQSIWILKRFRPDVVIACGGFASGPVGWMAAKLGIPLILQEQNSFPGVTTRLLAKHAAAIYTAFEDAAKYLPKEKIVMAGNPIRSSFQSVNREKALESFGFSRERPVLLVTGGSGGADTLNRAMEENLDELHNKIGLQMIWQCGNKYYEKIIRRVDEAAYPSLRLKKYIDNMPAAYAAADLVVTRAGAGACSELMLTGTPAILVPSPHVAGDHQRKNAREMSESGAALALEDGQVVNRLFELVKSLILDSERLDMMGREALKLARPAASVTIAKEILKRSGKAS